MKKKLLLIALGASTLALTACNQHSHTDAKTPIVAHVVAPHTQNEKVSYTIGYHIGESINREDKQTGNHLDNVLLKEGLMNSLQGLNPQITKKEMQTVMATYQKEMMAKMKAKHDKEAKANLASSSVYMSKIGKESGVKMLEKGLYYKVLTQGHGKVPKAHDTVEVNYSGTLPNGKIFDSSYARNKPATFKVNQVIKGWSYALQHMPVGSTWMLYITPKLAYGKFAPPSIGANQALTFKVDLMKIEKPKSKDKTDTNK